MVAPGFTLVELMVTLAVVAILLAVATPSFADLLRANRIAAANNALVTSLHVARAEALRRGRPVTVCPSVDQRSCSGSLQWGSGWVVFEDTQVAGAPVAPTVAGAGSARLIDVSPPVNGDVTLTGVDHWYRYSPTGGLIWSTAGGAAERSFTLAGTTCRGNQRRVVTVNRIGRVRSVAEACP